MPAASLQFSLWLGFLAAVLGAILLDVLIFGRANSHPPEAGQVRRRFRRPREPVIIAARTAFWLVLGVVCGFWIFHLYEHNIGGVSATIADPGSPLTGYGREAVVRYAAGWAIEYALSLDNLFVITLVFAFFRVPPEVARRLLLLGSLIAVTARAAMIALGGVAIATLPGAHTAFGILLILLALRMGFKRDALVRPGQNLGVRVLRRFMPVDEDDRSGNLLTPARAPSTSTPRARLGYAATPLLLALVAVETTDIALATDSVPAALAVTGDPFLVFTSNTIALLSLRAMYLAITGLVTKFRYLKLSLVFALAFIGVSTVMSDWYEGRPGVTLVVLLATMAIGIAASLIAAKRERRRLLRPAPVEDLAEAIEVTRRNLRRIVILIIGSTIVLVGMVMGVLPGPGGLPIVIAGLMLLATEFLWAQRLLKRLQNYALKMAKNADAVAQRSSPWLIPPVVLSLAAVTIAAAHYGPFPPYTVYFSTLSFWVPVVYWSIRTIKNARRRSAPAEPPPTPPSDSGESSPRADAGGDATRAP